MSNLAKEAKKQEKALYKEKVKANKKYIKNDTINKDFPKTSELPPNVAISAQSAWKIVAVEDKRYELVKGTSIDINIGDFVIIFGESGSGKTSLISLLSALERPSEGNVCMFGKNTCTMDNVELTSLREEFIGYIFQQYGLLRDITVLENILITCNAEDKKRMLKKNAQFKKEKSASLKKINSILDDLIDASHIHERAIWSYYISNTNMTLLNPKLYDYSTIQTVTCLKFYKIAFQKYINNLIYNLNEKYFSNEYIYEVTKMLEIDHLLNDKITKLSGGQQQRISIARAIAKKPKILFADEPTGAVDTATAKSIMKLFVGLNKEFGTTIVMVSHNNSLTPIANRIVTIQSGNIISDIRNEVQLDVDQIDFE